MIKKIFLTVVFCTVSVFTMAQSQTVTHVVQRGETIESIAEICKVSVRDINKANPNADGIVYVGMKLNVPIEKMDTYTDEAPLQDDAEQRNTQTVSYYSTPTKRKGNVSTNTWVRNQTRSMWGLTYFACDFEDVKASGHYGLTLDMLNIGESLFGFNTTLGSLNYGLVDKEHTTDLILFGPNVSYEIVQNVILSLPVQAMCNVSFEGSDTKTAWGWAISPRLYYSFGKVNVNAGILVNGGFKKEEDVTCGFTVGIGFGV